MQCLSDSGDQLALAEELLRIPLLRVARVVVGRVFRRLAHVGLLDALPRLRGAELGAFLESVLAGDLDSLRGAGLLSVREYFLLV